MYHLYKIDKVFKNMRMQKVCIVGDGLTGLTAALALSISGNYHVDLISKKKAGINTIDKRT